jgi:hypothetical protein
MPQRFNREGEMSKRAIFCIVVMMLATNAARADATLPIGATTLKLGCYCIYGSKIYSQGAKICTDAAQGLVCQANIGGTSTSFATWVLDTAFGNVACNYNPGNYNPSVKP